MNAPQQAAPGTKEHRLGPLRLPPVFDTVDERVDRAWDRFRGNPLADHVFYAASEMGDFGLIWMGAAALHAIAGDPRQGRALLRLAGALGVESLVVNQGLKRLFRRQRPNWEGPRPRGLRQPSTSSFPSGHSTSAVTAALLISQTSPVPAPVWWGLAGVVATSRIHVKIHHASDVAGGLLVGAAIGTVLKRLAPVR
jgi:membrane-associated phospholipid phosphatase